MAKEFGVSRVTIRNVLLRNGIRPKQFFSLNLTELAKIVHSKNGELLGHKYNRRRTWLNVRCKRHDFTWVISASNLRRGRWCRQCWKERDADFHRLKPNEVARRIKAWGGKLLSTAYKSNSQPLDIQCSEGHPPFQLALGFLGRVWCPVCTGTAPISESVSRRYFEHFTGKSFPRKHPRWLQRLQLDGYCEELKVAFEYDGIQHYRYFEPFHKTEANFAKVKARDRRKSRLCQAQGVHLIRISYRVSLQGLGSFILRQLRKRRIPLVSSTVPGPEDLGVFKAGYLKAINKIVNHRGGALLDNAYLGYDQKLRIDCGKGHTFRAGWNTLRMGNWCPYCFNRLTDEKKSSILRAFRRGDSVKKIAADLGVARVTVRTLARKTGLGSRGEQRKTEVIERTKRAISLRQAGYTLDRACREAGVSFPTLVKALRKSP